MDFSIFFPHKNADLGRGMVMENCETVMEKAWKNHEKKLFAKSVRTLSDYLLSLLISTGIPAVPVSLGISLLKRCLTSKI